MSKQIGFIKKFLIMITLFALSILLGACNKSNNNAALLPVSTYSISGTVSGDIRQGVTVSVSGAVSAGVVTDSNGNYKVSGLPSGSYTVAPSKAGYTFTQPSTTVVISGADVSGEDFTSAATKYSINGIISGAVQAGVAITVSGTTEAGNALNTSVTTTGGNYSVSNIPNGNYTIVAARSGYSFSPASIAVTIAGGDRTASFTASVNNSVTFLLSGAVSGDIKAGVTINVTGATNASASTLGDGTYTIPNLPNGVYTLSASKSGYTFSGPLSVTVNGANSIGNNFTATAVLYSISGTVTGDVQRGVTLTVSGTTDAGASFGPVEAISAGDGTYSVSGVRNGDYTVVAAKPGYVLNPASIAVSIAGGNSTGRDFTASTSPLLAFRADGGTGTNGTGGNGGDFYAFSTGSIKVLKSGTVDASFPAPTAASEFGTNHYVVSAGTITVLVDDDPNDGEPHLYARSSDSSPYLYLGNGDGDATNDDAITGLTIDVGATLILADQFGWGYGSLQLDNDILINGTLTGDPAVSSNVYLEANVIEVGSTGKITASALNPDGNAGEIALGEGSGLTKTIINRGMIEAKGSGSGSGGCLYFEPSDLVVNYGIIDVSGGSAGGGGGILEAYVDYGDFYSSGTVRMNGGNGDTGGSTDAYGYEYSCYIATVWSGNTNGRNGDIFISGIWEAKGGDGANGPGGTGGYMYFETDGMGNITVNASLSVKGGNGTAGSSGGDAGQIYFDSYLYYGDPITRGKISIGGNYDLRGGNGDQDGGGGGYLEVQCQAADSSGAGSDVEFVGFPVISMNGGNGGQFGGGASGSAFGLYTGSYGAMAQPISNEADIQAKGGNATQAGSYGGGGGAVYIQTGTPADTNTVLTNSGNIDVSGGSGEVGGSAYDGGYGILLQAQHVDNSGNLTANGGSGTTGAGGNGGYIGLISDDTGTPTTNTGTLRVTGGAGNPTGNDGMWTYTGGII